ncbi:ESAT-6 protein secretion system EspG family protein [Nocardia tenerifensis]|uniref:ESAT-6 protein secretion system EspG family protein n=1 Tax=Nocardia tenerifensis TaxID=228006 RepID=A0A318K0B4_9NOCA|nr:ESX secretion-associated protein EspG [Nocardia tenerifensis]PXX61707.1 ESAT-6 protein secretion system EspG family protein [Nocardia tenerifensis]
MATLTLDGALVVAESLGVQTFPSVLALRARHVDHASAAGAREAATLELRERGVLDGYGDVRDDELAGALFALARPERELVLRIRRGTELHRVCLVRRGLDHAVAIRVGDELDIRPVWGDEDPELLARPLLDALGPAQPADIPTFRAPTDELRERLDAADNSATSAVYQLGLPEQDAITLGLALRQWTSLAELVCYAHADGAAVRSPATAAVYDTAAGRIIAGGSVAADGRAWTTLAPGTDRRLAHAVAAQIEALPQGRWMP